MMVPETMMMMMMDSSSLLCHESCNDISDNIAIAMNDDSSSNSTTKGVEMSWAEQSDDPLPSQEEEEEEWISGLIEKERLHSPEPDYTIHLHLRTHQTARQSAVNSLLKVHAFYGFDLTTAALAVNFVDRFLSRAYQKNKKMEEGKAWMPKLLSVACLSLAAKMEEIEVPLLLDLQEEEGEAEYTFDPKTVQRMELLVMSTLEWRMNSVTPFSYLDKFIQKLAIDQRYHSFLLSSMHHLILQTLKDIRFVEYRASVIAMVATMHSIRKILPLHFHCLKETILLHSPLCKETCSRCFELMDDLILENMHRDNWDGHNSIKRPALCYMRTNENDRDEDSTQSPLGVLDVSSSFSYQSESNSAADYETSYFQSSTSKKRRTFLPSK